MTDAAPPDEAGLLAEWQREEAVPFSGWDFAYLMAITKIKPKIKLQMKMKELDDMKKRKQSVMDGEQLLHEERGEGAGQQRD